MAVVAVDTTGINPTSTQNYSSPAFAGLFLFLPALKGRAIPEGQGNIREVLEAVFFTFEL
jgi:hypothetical protein